MDSDVRRYTSSTLRKDLHVVHIDLGLACVESSLVAPELAQVHDVESTVLHARCDDDLDLAQVLSDAFTAEHVLIDTNIEAPNAESGRAPRP